MLLPIRSCCGAYSIGPWEQVRAGQRCFFVFFFLGGGGGAAKLDMLRVPRSSIANYLGHTMQGLGFSKLGFALNPINPKPKP